VRRVCRLRLQVPTISSCQSRGAWGFAGSFSSLSPANLIRSGVTCLYNRRVAFLPGRCACTARIPYARRAWQAGGRLFRWGGWRSPVRKGETWAGVAEATAWRPALRREDRRVCRYPLAYAGERSRGVTNGTPSCCQHVKISTIHLHPIAACAHLLLCGNASCSAARRHCILRDGARV